MSTELIAQQLEEKIAKECSHIRDLVRNRREGDRNAGRIAGRMIAELRPTVLEHFKSYVDQRINPGLKNLQRSPELVIIRVKYEPKYGFSHGFPWRTEHHGDFVIYCNCSFKGEEMVFPCEDIPVRNLIESKSLSYIFGTSWVCGIWPYIRGEEGFKRALERDQY